MAQPTGRQRLVAAQRPGGAARGVVEESRERIAAALGARPSEVVFTCGRHRGRQPRRQGRLLGPPGRATRAASACSSRAVEHHAVLDPVEWLADARGRRGRPGCRWTGAAGIDLDALREALGRTRRRSRWSRVMWANNEVGTVQPVARGRRASRTSTASRCTPTPCRRSGTVPVDFAASGVDLHDASPAHKIGGPVGVGALAARGATPRSSPLLHGGGQEREVRSRHARHRRRRRPSPSRVEVAVAERDASAAGRRLRDGCVERAVAAVPGRAGRGADGDPARAGCPATRTSPSRAARATRCCYLLDAAGHRVLDRLGLPGRRRRSPATCCSRWASPRPRPAASLRFSLGHTSTEADVDALARGAARAPSSGPGGAGLRPRPDRVAGGLTCGSSRR